MSIRMNNYSGILTTTAVTKVVPECDNSPDSGINGGPDGDDIRPSSTVAIIISLMVSNVSTTITTDASFDVFAANGVNPEINKAYLGRALPVPVGSTLYFDAKIILNTDQALYIKASNANQISVVAGTAYKDQI